MIETTPFSPRPPNQASADTPARRRLAAALGRWVTAHAVAQGMAQAAAEASAGATAEAGKGRAPEKGAPPAMAAGCRQGPAGQSPREEHRAEVAAGGGKAQDRPAAGRAGADKAKKGSAAGPKTGSRATPGGAGGAPGDEGQFARPLIARMQPSVMHQRTRGRAVAKRAMTRQDVLIAFSARLVGGKIVIEELGPDDLTDEDLRDRTPRKRAPARPPTVTPMEGQSFIIEYMDGRGQLSQRRISVWGIDEGSEGIPRLVARCHEQQATRRFRIDRIRSVISLDGEVFDDVGAYLADRLGLEGAPDAIARAPRPGLSPAWPKMLELCRPYAILLGALSVADGRKIQVEIDAAADFCVWLCRKAGLEPDEPERQAFGAFMKGMRPAEMSVVTALDALMSEEPETLTAFARAGRAVIEADGVLHPAEVALLNEIARELFGVEIA